jgi:ABC-type multidrug transport system ATPase subunit
VQVERLTVRENLLFFGRIKGIEEPLVEPVCEAFLSALDIKRYENKQIQHLSGGNRRKVSLAVALLGAPPTVYLDEPSTGLDVSVERSLTCPLLSSFILLSCCWLLCIDSPWLLASCGACCPRSVRPRVAP